eukprot:9296784-Karenia_brevis.AAC.1
MATLNEALGRWTLGMQKEISASSRQMEANVQSALQKHGQTLVLSLNEILEARCKPMQKAIDQHTAEIQQPRALVASMEKKFESIHKQL